MKFWWPLFLALKFTFLFITLAKIHIFIPKCIKEGGSTGLGNIPKKTFFYCFSNVLLIILWGQTVVERSNLALCVGPYLRYAYYTG